MVVLVLLVALVMILGGGAATFFGSDILLADRGLPMVVAGATVASAGAVMLGLALVARGLSRIERQAAQIRDGIADLRAANLLATARPPQRTTTDTPTAVVAAVAEEPDVTEEGATLVVPEAPGIRRVSRHRDASPCEQSRDRLSHRALRPPQSLWSSGLPRSSSPLWSGVMNRAGMPTRCSPTARSWPTRPRASSVSTRSTN